MQKKYLSIYYDLVKSIQTNVWPTASMLPSEKELTITYDTSRETIRKALNLLAQNGYIQKIRGKGSMVIDREKLSFPVSGITSFKELANNLELDTQTSVVNLEHITETDQVRSLLELGEQEDAWKVYRVRTIDGVRVILDKDYFIGEIVPKLPANICEESIYEYIEEEIGLTIGFAQKEIMVEEPTEEDKVFLDLEGFSNVVVIKSLIYLEDARLFQYTESRHRPDRFRFVDFARRIK